MQFEQVYLCVVLFIGGSHALAEEVEYIEQNDAVSNQTAIAYSVGVHMGIINPEKYSLASFERDERNIFKDLYKEYILLNGSQPINYEEWLIMNNFGILPDTQESLFHKQISRRNAADNKRLFVNVVKKGDILIAGCGNGGLVGHAAIMTTDYWVLDMPGGRGWQNGIRDNNRQLAKDQWYDEYASHWTTVYRCRDRSVAKKAAVWADFTYYNSNGGAKKTKHITYRITTDFESINPSYSSKLVLQAYYFGIGSKQVIRDVMGVVVPSSIPAYFLPPYTLMNKGKY